MKRHCKLCNKPIDRRSLTGLCRGCRTKSYRRESGPVLVRDTAHNWQELSDNEVADHFKSLVQCYGGGFVPIYPCKVIGPGHPEWAKLVRKYGEGA